MGLYYKSTRNSNLKVTASEAILKGLAPDGGLFVPSELPKLDVTMSDLKGKTYEEIQERPHLQALRMWKERGSSYSIQRMVSARYRNSRW